MPILTFHALANTMNRCPGMILAIVILLVTNQAATGDELASVDGQMLKAEFSSGESEVSDWSVLERHFRELPMEARRLTGPLFWLHGTETREELESTLARVVEGGNGSFTAESRPHNDWLGEGWYRDLDICLAAAKKHDLQMWIFDDYWWPSQMMGGRVPPEYGSKVLEAAAVTVTGPGRHRADGCAGKQFIMALAGQELDDGTVDGATLVDLKDSIQDGTLDWQVPAGRWKVMTFTWAFKGPVGAQKKFISVDGASPECVDWFINAVYQPHYDRYGDDFGKTIAGYFYDEPETQGDWGSDLPVWMAEHGIDLKKTLVAYKFKLAGDDQVAGLYSYLDAVAESWGRTMYGGMSRWCREHGVISMGHFMEHSFFDRGMCGGNVMQLMKHSDRGGIDLVCQQLYPGQRWEEYYQMPKLASSVSHLYGCEGNRDIAFNEIFGAYEQSLTYAQMKWLADWNQVRGVNFMVTHSFNPRAPLDKDCPPYFYNGGFEPRWPLYQVWADYSSRLSLMLTGGRHVCPVAFVHVGQSMHVGRALRPEAMTSALQDALYDCDWLPYDAWEDRTRIDGKILRLRQEDYRVLVLPAAEVIPYETLAKAKAFLDAGGVVIGYGILPTRSATLGKTSADMAALRQAIWGPDPSMGTKACRVTAAGGRSYFLPEKPSSAQIQAALAGDAGIHPTLEVVEGPTDDWLHVLHRRKAGRDLFLVCNQDHLGEPRNFRLRLSAPGYPECWDAMRNEIGAVPYQRHGDAVEVALTLEPSESALLVFQQVPRDRPPRYSDSSPQREIIVRDTSPTEGAQRKKVQVIKATYGIPGNPGLSRDAKPQLERLLASDMRRIQVKELARWRGNDPARGRIKTFQAELRIGDQMVTINAQDEETIDLSDLEPGPGYQTLSRQSNDHRFTAYQGQAAPFTGVALLPEDIDLSQVRVVLALDDVAFEEAAAVTVNGHSAGGFIGRPYRLDLTQQLKPGRNEIRIDPFAPTNVRLLVGKHR